MNVSDPCRSPDLDILQSLFDSLNLFLSKRRLRDVPYLAFYPCHQLLLAVYPPRSLQVNDRLTMLLSIHASKTVRISPLIPLSPELAHTLHELILGRVRLPLPDTRLE